jgi:hypothetical protein
LSCSFFSPPSLRQDGRGRPGFGAEEGATVPATSDDHTGKADVPALRAKGDDDN